LHSSFFFPIRLLFWSLDSNFRGICSSWWLFEVLVFVTKEAWDLVSKRGSYYVSYV
jgi:hypothetical protein